MTLLNTVKDEAKQLAAVQAAHAETLWKTHRAWFGASLALFAIGFIAGKLL